MEAEEPTGPGPNLIKGLASNNASIRSKSLRTLLTWLPSQTLISDDIMKKLWKSLFYCMWHSDKVENQSHLINCLSSMIPSLPTSVCLPYFSHFLGTMRREWPGIDRLRLDKFYRLIRFFIGNLFVMLKKKKWDLDVLEDFVGVLEKRVFLVDDERLGNGVSYHIVSVFFDEIECFLPLRLEVLNVLFRPFVAVLSKSGDKVLLSKVKSYVFDVLIKNGKGLLEAKKSGAEIDEKSEMVKFGTVAFVMDFSSRLYELGSAPKCIQGNRKFVYGLHEGFSKLEKEKSSLGIDVSLPVVDDDDDGQNDQEMPQLIPTSGAEIDEDSMVELSNVNGKSKSSKAKKSKKKKKKKNGVIDQTEVSESENNCNGDLEIVQSIDNNANGEEDDDIDEVVLSEVVMSNLQKQFERIAAESGLDGDGVSALDSPSSVQVNGKPSKKKKKRRRSTSSAIVTEAGEREDIEVGNFPRTEEKGVKRVRFAMKNNLVWKPHSPMPPQSLRIPPSAAPRGSALKQGLSPGPIRDVSQDFKKGKKKKASPLKKKMRKVKTISPAIKRVKKVKPTFA